MWEKYLILPKFLRISGRDVEKTLTDMNLRKDVRVLDLGCAYGRISSFLKNNGYDVIAIDNNKKMVKFIKNLGIKTFLMDGNMIGFKKNSFDLIVTDGLLEHFKEPNKILNEESRVTKKYSVNFIPKNTKINKFLEVLQRTPKVYWKNEKEWLQLHKKYFKKVFSKELLRLEAYICEKY
jgi:ubiquinone/menaquinone biosynthesis C-methylase UbiE